MRKIFSIFFFSLSIVSPLSAQVDTAWVRTYSGPSDWNWVTRMAVDKSGNVYVSGYSSRAYYVSDYATVKYYPNGDTAWVRRYCGPTDGEAGANDLAIDDSGNVYVTGFSPDTIFGQWYATIKYYPNGDTAWIRRYHGKGYGYDTGLSIAVDDLLNVYVTGASTGNGMYDYGTIKYYPSGDTAWVRLYDGSRGYDVPQDLQVDTWGNVYVTGISVGSIGYDYATVKYYPNGDTAWVRRYDGPESKYDAAIALCVDDSACVYVTGISYSGQTGLDYLTIKYYPNGDTAWVRRYNGPGNGSDSAMAIAVDERGSVYVTGTSYGVGTARDYATLKYSPDGRLIWERRYNGTGNSNDYAHSLAIDGHGNVYVTGYSSNPAGSYDLATVKYSPDGNGFCVRRFGKISGYEDYFCPDITVNSFENVYVAGAIGNPPDYTTIRYYPIILVGDANNDRSITVADPVYLINYVFKGGSPPIPIRAGDVDGDGSITVTDIIYLINYLFKGGPPPVC
jgi:hypothetical protein